MISQIKNAILHSKREKRRKSERVDIGKDIIKSNITDISKNEEMKSFNLNETTTNHDDLSKENLNVPQNTKANYYNKNEQKKVSQSPMRSHKSIKKSINLTKSKSPNHIKKSNKKNQNISKSPDQLKKSIKKSEIISEIKIHLSSEQDYTKNLLNILIGDNDKQICQSYKSKPYEDIYKRSFFMLNNLKIGFDADYITGITLSYLVTSNSLILQEFIEVPDSFNIISIEDPAILNGKPKTI